MDEDLLSPARRSLLRLAALAAVSSALSGCGLLLTKRPTIICRTPTEVPEPQYPQLTIDTHCHIFNGSDLQVKEFFDRVVSHEKGLSGDVVGVFADLLQDLEWSGAPDGNEELVVLGELKKCSNGGIIVAVADLKESKYGNANKAIRHTKVFTQYSQQPSASHTLSEPNGVRNRRILSDVDQRLHPKYADYIRTREEKKKTIGLEKNLTPNSTIPTEDRTLVGMLDYFVQNYQYRYVSVQEYLETFHPSSGRIIDLMLAHMVDYDWWLSKGKQTKTHLLKQVEVMEQISILTRGRVHGFVPFDPLREVAFLAHKHPTTHSSLDFVQKAVLNHGCIGVKLYPPMGFAPYGNSTITTPHFWKSDGLPGWMDGLIKYPSDNTSLGIGQRLDDALAALYDWCCEQEVPIMAHSNMTNGNGPNGKYETLAGSYYWQKALEKWPRLRICFGHLGDFSNLTATPNDLDATKLIALMNAKESHAYADTGYYSEVLDQTQLLASRIESFYGSSSTVLPQRFMYGTDWSLLMNQGDVTAYLDDFIRVFEGLDEKFHSTDGLEVSQRFFGYNAVEWIGLRNGECARKRLECFYKAHGINWEADPPHWMAKVDKFPQESTTGAMRRPIWRGSLIA